MRKVDLYLVFNVEFGGKYEERNYDGFADYLERETAKMVGKNPSGKEINPKEIVDQLLSHTEAEEVRNDENLEALVSLIPFIAYNYICQVDETDMDGMYDDSIKIFAADSGTGTIKWSLVITSISGIQRGYDVLDWANGDTVFKFK